jgi:hypothetical protein
VSVLDLAANLGPEGRNHIRSEASYWKQWLEKNG